MVWQEIVFYVLIGLIVLLNFLSEGDVSGKATWVIGALLLVLAAFWQPWIKRSIPGLIISPILLCVGAAVPNLFRRR